MTEDEARAIVRESRAKWAALGGCLPTISEDDAVRFLMAPDRSDEPLTLAKLQEAAERALMRSR